MDKDELLNRIKALDYDKVKNKIVSFLEYEARNNSRDTFIIGLSGGIDSSVTARLAVESSIKVIGLVMPYSKTTPKKDVNDAIELAEENNIRYIMIELDDIYETMLEHLPFDRYSAGNLLARLRMNLLYYYSNLTNGLVLGTGDRSELLIGYFTKYGDGASDLMPIASLYKLQVRELARYLGIKDSIIAKKSSPRLWKGHTAEKELGLSYEEIDSILYCLFDLKMAKEDIIRIGFSKESIDKVISMHRKANHKRSMPKICMIN